MSNWRETVKKIPGAVPVVRTMRKVFVKKEAPVPVAVHTWARQEVLESDDVAVARRKRILNVLDRTKTSGVSYAATVCPAGYHTITLNGETFGGQRNPKQRVDAFGLDFSGKSLLDIGSNQGGMVFSVQDQLRWAVGVDWDSRMINASNLIAREMGVDKARFFVFDIDKDPHVLLKDFLPENRVDVVFLLSVCVWVERWREMMTFASTICDTMVLESNGTDEQKDEQEALFRALFAHVRMVWNHSEDDPLHKARRVLVGSHHPF